MNDRHNVPGPVDVDEMAHVCEGTWQGWVWYCDVHDTHGNADHQEEATVVARAHADFWARPGGDLEPCKILVWFRSPA